MTEDLKKINEDKIIKLLVVDNCKTVRQSIKSILELEDNIKIIG
jgi:hypothetical protein